MHQGKIITTNEDRKRIVEPLNDINGNQFPDGNFSSLNLGSSLMKAVSEKTKESAFALKATYKPEAKQL